MSTGSSDVDSCTVVCVNNKGDSTAPWGEPVLFVTIFEKTVSEQFPFLLSFNLTYWGLAIKKLTIQAVRCGFKASLCSLEIKRCGWKVLKAEEKSTNNILQ